MTQHRPQTTEASARPASDTPDTPGTGRPRTPLDPRDTPDTAPGVSPNGAPAPSGTNPAPSAIRAVVFDIDDTICDSARAFSIGIRKIVARYMPGLDEEQTARAIDMWREDPNGHYRRYTRGECTFDEQRFARANELNEAFGGPALSWQDYLDEWKPLFWNTFCSNWTAHDDVRPCLDALHALGLRLGALSNAAAELQTRKLAACGCADEVPLLVTMDTFGFGKPDPRVFREAARRLGLDPGEVAYVGDEFDIDAQAACVAGMHGFWIDRPSRHLDSRHALLKIPDTERSAAQVTRIASLTELPALLGA
ncbi:HAD family hydrolase [Pseudoscardovia radai]|uniref:HAD family hydrolase n=1 Tax=Pseudoscardovia radai TaxID=987066 RepID=UPI0039947072